MNNGIISIGCDCTPRVNMKKMLGLSKKNGYHSCPLDLVLSNETALSHHFKNDFCDFFDNLHIIKECPLKCNTCINSPYTGYGLISNKYGIIFEHESPTHAHLFRDG